MHTLSGFRTVLRASPQTPTDSWAGPCLCAVAVARGPHAALQLVVHDEGCAGRHGSFKHIHKSGMWTLCFSPAGWLRGVRTCRESHIAVLGHVQQL